jgi:hypothetical protein
VEVKVDAARAISLCSGESKGTVEGPLGGHIGSLGSFLHGSTMLDQATAWTGMHKQLTMHGGISGL